MNTPGFKFTFIILLSLIFATSLTGFAQQTPDSTNKPIIKVFEEDNDIFMVVENQPEFPGGDKALKNFLGDNIKYPAYAREAGISGTVYISFVVETDGSLSNIRVLQAVGGGCDEEAIRVVKLMPNWKPGKQRGNPVRVQYNMPIKFTLAK